METLQVGSQDKRNALVEIVHNMKKVGLVPVFYHHDIEVARAILDTGYKAGIKVFEFTNRGEDAIKVFSELVEHANDYQDCVLGIGTIFSSDQAKKFHDLGARFIVSPALVPEVADFSNKKDLLWIPGCGSVTEIYNAMQIGAKVIKVFPGNVLGPGFVKSIRAVLPEVTIMPTGGVKPTFDNLKSWFDAGSDFVGMGSQLFGKKLIEDKDYDELYDKINKTLSMIDNIKAR